MERKRASFTITSSVERDGYDPANQAINAFSDEVASVPGNVDQEIVLDEFLARCVCIDNK
jgi:hypothetical protein